MAVRASKFSKFDLIVRVLGEQGYLAKLRSSFDYEAYVPQYMFHSSLHERSVLTSPIVTIVTM